MSDPQVVWLRTTEYNIDGHEAGEWANSALTRGGLKPVKVAIPFTTEYRSELRALVDRLRTAREDYANSLMSIANIEQAMNRTVDAIEAMLEATN
jgi:hypothetical protein